MRPGKVAGAVETLPSPAQVPDRPEREEEDSEEDDMEEMQSRLEALRS